MERFEASFSATQLLTGEENELEEEILFTSYCCPALLIRPIDYDTRV